MVGGGKRGRSRHWTSLVVAAAAVATLTSSSSTLLSSRLHHHYGAHAASVTQSSSSTYHHHISSPPLSVAAAAASPPPPPPPQSHNDNFITAATTHAHHQPQQQPQPSSSYHRLARRLILQDVSASASASPAVTMPTPVPTPVPTDPPVTPVPIELTPGQLNEVKAACTTELSDFLSTNPPSDPEQSKQAAIAYLLDLNQKGNLVGECKTTIDRVAPPGALPLPTPLPTPPPTPVRPPQPPPTPVPTPVVIKDSQSDDTDPKGKPPDDGMPPFSIVFIVLGCLMCLGMGASLVHQALTNRRRDRRQHLGGIRSTYRDGDDDVQMSGREQNAHFGNTSTSTNGSIFGKSPMVVDVDSGSAEIVGDQQTVEVAE